MTPGTDPHSFDPFRAAAGESSTTTRCPKCQWAQSPDRTSCAACGLIFSRYAAAQARATRTPRSSFEGLSSSGPSSSAALPAPALTSSLPPDGSSAGAVVGSAMSSSWATVMTLVGIHLVPLFGVGVAAVLVATAVPTVMQMGRHLEGAGFFAAAAVGVVLAVMAWLLLLRVTTTISVAVMLTVDEHQRTGDARGVFAALGEGWDFAVRAVGVVLATSAIASVPMLPLIFMWSKASSGSLGAVALVGVVAAVWIAFVVVRFALALPAVVLGDRSVVGALRESWALTQGRFIETAGVVILGGLVMMVVSGVCAALSWIPVVGMVVGAVGSVVVTGIGVGVSAALWRDRVEA